MVCGLQHKATHERTTATVTTINLRHRWAIYRKNTSCGGNRVYCMLN